MIRRKSYIINVILISAIIFIHSILLTNLFAQNSLTLSFEWEPIQTVVDKKNGTADSILFFNKATMDEKQPFLPYYEEVIPLPSSEFEASLSILAYDTKSFFLDSLPSNIQSADISDTIYYETEKFIARKQAYARIKIYPFHLSSGQQQLNLITSIDYSIDYTITPSANAKQGKQHQYASKSVLAEGDWHKLQIKRSGIYKISYNDLSSYGLPVESLDPTTLQVYGNGGQQLPYDNADPHPDDLLENAIYVHGQDDHSFDPGDYILFYGEGPHQWSYDSLNNRFTYAIHEYDDEAYYFLTWDQNTGKRIQTAASPSAAANQFSSTYNNFKNYEVDSISLIQSGRTYFGDHFDMTTQYTYSFTFPELNPSHNVKFRTSLAARHTSNSQFSLNINGQNQYISIAAIDGDYRKAYAKQSIDTFSLDINSSNIDVNVSYQKPANSAMGWTDFIEVNARENLSFINGSQLDFRDIAVIGPGNIVEYSLTNASSSLQIWDVTDAQNPQQMATQLSGSNMSFKAAADSLKEYVAFNNSFYKPTHKGSVKNQNLHGLPHADMLIVTHPDLAEQANEIADIHRDHDQMTVHITEPAYIYNEFSSGQQDIAAIRNFVRMFYDRASNTEELPKYLLLMGDGNYDPKNRNNINQATILTFQSKTSLSPSDSYVSDDFYGVLDPGEGVNAQGGLDIGIGRIPVGNAEQARIAVAKIRRYMNLDTLEMQADLQKDPNLRKTLGNWRNTISFIADDEDGNAYITQADNIAEIINNGQPSFLIEKIFLDAYQQINTPGGQRYPEVNKAINERMEKGALIINYIGHGGVAGLADEEIVRIRDINSWNNKYNLPVFMTATCEFSRFDDPERVSAGEYVFLNPEGGAVSLFTTTRLAWSGNNYSLNVSFYNNLFNKNNGEYQRMGTLMQQSKLGANSNSRVRNFVLLGDPALQMAFPEKQVITTKINNQDTSYKDTLQALSKATIEGFIATPSGDIDTSFNGIIYPSIYDKKSTYSTLGQDANSNVKQFTVRDKLLYKGKASVTNGQFSFSFVVPKDIDYNLGKGKIFYYAENGITDANGYYDNFYIGGTSDSASADNSGPEISLYMNDFSFESGDLTDENPVLLARIFDENGINTVGNGIGHDIVAILDENTDNQLVLNDYYEADLDNYKQGTVRYPYHELEEGKHTLTVKVWDVFNNSSTASIDFVVTKSDIVSLENLTAYPNPSNGSVWFSFDHNQARKNMEFIVDIYSLDGRLMQTLQTTISPEGYSASDLKWDGRTQSGNPVKSGLFIYRARLKTDNGISKQKAGKIVIMN
ncbi:MAG: type IX secretion system sortase PorU [Bacteroidota bacterium]